jgi:hypothetical protein
VGVQGDQGVQGVQGYFALKNLLEKVAAFDVMIST